MIFRFPADVLPSRALTSSYWTFWPFLHVDNAARSTADTWTNTSRAPFSGWINPNPLPESNHFTVPAATDTSRRKTAVANATVGVRCRARAFHNAQILLCGERFRLPELAPAIKKRK